jgi:hypothetical protein
VARKSVNLKHSIVLTGMFSLKTARQFVERYHRVVNSALDMEGLILKNICKISK